MRLLKECRFLAGLIMAFPVLALSCQVRANTTDSIATPLKVSILGDSYSTFEGWVPEGYDIWYRTVPPKGRDTDVTKVEQTWWKKYIDQKGYILEANNSFSGATVCNTGYDGNDYSAKSFVNRTGLLGNPDLIFVFGGTNDSWAGSPLGEYVWDDWTPEQAYSYRPALAQMTYNLINSYPNARIVFLINDGIDEEVKNSTKKVCDHYNVQYIQLEGIEKKTGHPDERGMQQIVEQIIEAGL